MLGPLLFTAIPASLGAFIGFSQNTINLIYVGTLNDTKALAAVGLGEMFVTMFGIAVFYGFNGALETLVSQARGSNNFRQCGILLLRGRIINILIYSMILVILLNATKIL